MTWYQIFGFLIFWVALVSSIILYILKRKWYPIMYLISVSLYVFTIGFVIDVFNFSVNLILFVLAFSAVVMIASGIYLSKKFPK